MDLHLRSAFGFNMVEGNFSTNTGTTVIPAPASGRIVVDLVRVYNSAASVVQILTPSGVKGPKLAGDEGGDVDESHATIFAAPKEAVIMNATGGGEYYIEYHIEGIEATPPGPVGQFSPAQPTHPTPGI